MGFEEELRDYDKTAGIIILSLIVVGIGSGTVLGNWAVIETLLGPVLLGVLIILFYRLVVAVEHMAYED